jgi:hypothetical protein
MTHRWIYLTFVGSKKQQITDVDLTGQTSTCKEKTLAVTTLHAIKMSVFFYNLGLTQNLENMAGTRIMVCACLRLADSLACLDL